MKLFDSKPHIFLWLSIPFILLMGISDLNESININFHDTYFVVSNWHLAILISMYFALLGLIYWSLIKSEFKPIEWLTLIHLGCTIDTLFFIWLILFFDWFSKNNSTLLTEISNQSWVIISCLGLFILGQIIFVINVLFTITMNKSATSG